MVMKGGVMFTGRVGEIGRIEDTEDCDLRG